jgi:hypothetical protein
MRYGYAAYGPGSSPSNAATITAPEQGDRSESQPRILCRESDGRWTLRHTGDGPAVHTSEPMDIIDATWWAGELIGAGNGAWKPVDEHGPLYHQEGDRWVPNEGPVYRWEPGTDHIQRCS